VALGANLPTERHGPPRAALDSALAELARRGVRILRRSRWYESAPVPVSDQPWFVNGVAEVETALGPEALLALLHEVEAAFGRVRREANAPRTLDLDLIAYGDVIAETPALILPHPRAAERDFVLGPWLAVDPDAVLPGRGKVADLLQALREGGNA
jgi:2-amino-4-hydroxy-6-hydroxymethyldihydropteridine diphosphokinase